MICRFHSQKKKLPVYLWWNGKSRKLTAFRSEYGVECDRLPFTVIEHSLWHSAITDGMSELWWRTAIHRKIRKACGKRIWKRNMEFEGERTLNSGHRRSKNRERDVWRTVWKLDLLNLTTCESQAPVKSEWVRQGRRAKVFYFGSSGKTEARARRASQEFNPIVQTRGLG